MYHADQKWRKEYIKRSTSEYRKEEIIANEEKADAQNLEDAKQIIAGHGYPGFDLVGENDSRRFWAIIQHCDTDVPFQEKALELMREQVKRKNASGEDFAYLLDRCTFRHPPQAALRHPITIRPRNQEKPRFANS